MGTGVGVGVEDAVVTRNASKSTDEGSPPAGRDSCKGAEASGAMVGLDVGCAWEDGVSWCRGGVLLLLLWRRARRGDARWWLG